jgi:hypothetical protein
MLNGGSPKKQQSGSPASGGSLAELRGLRVELAERVAALTWDLGGLTYEMAVRDHYRLDVIAKRAAELQQADAQLGEVERLLSTAQAGIGGVCVSCGSVHSRGAAYCWHCGAPLLQESRPSVLPGPASEDGIGAGAQSSSGTGAGAEPSNANGVVTDDRPEGFSAPPT